MFEQIPETPYGIKKRIQFVYGEIEKRISNLNRDRKEIKILDIGCGTGELITIPLGHLGASVLGIDIHPPSIYYANRKNPFENVRFECISVDKLADQQFDFIICSEVLEHLEDPSEMLNQIRKKLKRNGTCIITIPNGYGPKEMEIRLYKALDKLKVITLLKFLNKHFKRLCKKGGVESSSSKDSLNTESPHVQFFSYGQFKNLLKECKLSIMKMKNRRFLSGPFSDIILSRSKILINWNVKVASKLPYFLASSWMFVVKHQEVQK
ncbi:Ubiquinone biosynthesis O-methyltransferase, mitochondrial [subsurface metagenome]|nr:methyltransferase domain-containing protein [Hadesarchaea archaeon]